MSQFLPRQLDAGTRLLCLVSPCCYCLQQVSGSREWIRLGEGARRSWGDQAPLVQEPGAAKELLEELLSVRAAEPAQKRFYPYYPQPPISDCI